MTKRVAIIGGGPAGLSCALWLQLYDITPLVFEKGHTLGGLQAENPHPNLWVLGQVAKTGEMVAQSFRHHASINKIPHMLNTAVTQIEKISNGFLVKSANNEFAADAVVLAVGTRPRGLEVYEQIPGYQHLLNFSNSIYHPGDSIALFGHLAGKEVCIVGGGDNAVGVALNSANLAKHVHLIVRSQMRALGNRQQLLKTAVSEGKVTVYIPSEITQFYAEADKLGIDVLSKGTTTHFSADHFISQIGYHANTDKLQSGLILPDSEKLATDSLGYVKVDDDMRTMVQGIYAAGDIANPIHPCVATAVAQGTMAARTIEADLRETLF